MPESMKDRGDDDESNAGEAPASGGGGAASTTPGDTVEGAPQGTISDAEVHQFQRTYGALLDPAVDDAAASKLLFPELPYSHWDDATKGKAAPKRTPQQPDTQRQCRICLCTEDEESDEREKGTDLIAPCRCRGTAHWVHRACLDKWRATQEDRAFAQCTECHFLYRFESVEKDDNDDNGNTARPWSDRRRLRCRYWTNVVRDTVLSLLGVATLVAALSALVWVFGVRGPTQAGTTTTVPPSTSGNGTMTNTTPPCDDAACQVGFSLAGGICILLTVLGCYGLFLLCMHDCSPSEVMDDIAGGDARWQRGRNSSSTGDCCSGCYYCGPCDCGGGGGGNDECCVIVVLVFGVVLLILGFFVGMAMAMVKVRYTLQKYSWMLQKKRLAKVFRVQDLHGIDLDGLGDAESGVAAVTPPSATVEPTITSPKDAKFLKEMGLL